MILHNTPVFLVMQSLIAQKRRLFVTCPRCAAIVYAQLDKLISPSDCIYPTLAFHNEREGDIQSVFSSHIETKPKARKNQIL